MPLVNLRGLEDALGLPRPIHRGIVTMTVWAGAGPLTRIEGDRVVFARTIRVNIVDGVPEEQINLQPTGGVCCIRWGFTSFGGGPSIPARYTEIPDVPEVDFGDLVQVDPHTYAPAAAPGLVDTIRSEVASWLTANPPAAGAPGESAYQAAVDAGFVGTVDEWLASLQGEDGDPGDDSTVPGPPNVLTIGTVTTLPAGDPATAAITGDAPAQVLDLGIPAGHDGGGAAMPIYTTRAELDAIRTPGTGMYTTDDVRADFPEIIDYLDFAGLTGAVEAPTHSYEGIDPAIGVQVLRTDITTPIGYIRVVWAPAYEFGYADFVTDPSAALLAYLSPRYLSTIGGVVTIPHGGTISIEPGSDVTTVNIVGYSQGTPNVFGTRCYLQVGGSGVSVEGNPVDAGYYLLARLPAPAGTRIIKLGGGSETPVAVGRAGIAALREPGLGIYRTTDLAADFPEIPAEGEWLDLMGRPLDVPIETTAVHAPGGGLYYVRTIIDFDGAGKLRTIYLATADLFVAQVVQDLSQHVEDAFNPGPVVLTSTTGELVRVPNGGLAVIDYTPGINVSIAIVSPWDDFSFSGAGSCYIESTDNATINSRPITPGFWLVNWGYNAFHLIRLGD